MTKKLLVAGGVVLIGIAAFLLWPRADRSVVIPIEGSDLGRGERLYAENCASCHGARLQGMPNWRQPGPDGVLPAPPHDETGHTWHHGDGLLLDYAKSGGQAALAALGVTGVKSGMPAFEGVLSDPEIRDILAWIKSTWPEDVRQAQKARTAEESR